MKTCARFVLAAFLIAFGFSGCVSVGESVYLPKSHSETYLHLANARITDIRNSGDNLLQFDGCDMIVRTASDEVFVVRQEKLSVTKTSCNRKAINEVIMIWLHRGEVVEINWGTERSLPIP